MSQPTPSPSPLSPPLPPKRIDAPNLWVHCGACARCGAPIFVRRPVVEEPDGDYPGRWARVPEARHSCRCFGGGE